jgi:hypothetical protein
VQIRVDVQPLHIEFVARQASRLSIQGPRPTMAEPVACVIIKPYSRGFVATISGLRKGAFAGRPC